MDNEGAVTNRFWSKVKKSEYCWEWMGAFRGKNNYGAFTIGRKTLSAPRFSYELSHGKIPKGLFILHVCDNRKCVRPDHLESGNQSKNIRDCVARGRHIAPKGERNGMAILTHKEVEAIRIEYDGKHGSMTRLAAKHKISVSAIHAIIRKNRWA